MNYITRYYTSSENIIIDNIISHFKDNLVIEDKRDNISKLYITNENEYKYKNVKNIKNSYFNMKYKIYDKKDLTYIKSYL